jgi:hypothetical protein
MGQDAIMIRNVRRLVRRLRARWGPALQSDVAFIESAYREILGRNADLDGLNHYRRGLRDGLGRTAVLLDLMRSAEFTAKLAAKAPSMPNLRAIRPERYRETIDRSNGETIPVFDAAAASDFDWLEAAIVEHGYYEQPGVWTLGVDADKRVMAEMVASFAPRRALELGCAAGAVLECLEDHGILAEGVEISSMAIAKAPERVRGRIHQGDLLSLRLSPEYDLVFGLDVFEHLNPNRLELYLRRLAEMTSSDGFLFCNIPAFGDDPVFGAVFPYYIDEWRSGSAEERPFSTLHVDALGYPIHGHLTWADARWWVARVEAAGFAREIEIERAFHEKYDHYMETRAPARKAYFVFGKRPPADRREAVIRRIRRDASRVPGV